MQGQGGGAAETVSRLKPSRQWGLHRGVPGMLHSRRCAGVAIMTFTEGAPLVPASRLGWEFASKQAAAQHFEQPYAVLALE